MANLYQEDTIGEPQCDRNGDPGKNLVKVPSLWTTSIPHPQDSGRCFTYKYRYCFCKNKHFSSLPKRRRVYIDFNNNQCKLGVLSLLKLRSECNFCRLWGWRGVEEQEALALRFTK